MSIINATLPIQMKVIAKSGFNNYTLLLNHKEVSTKSLIELEIGAEYLAELYTSKGGVITFKNLYKKPYIAHFEEGLALIVRLLDEPNFDFKAFVLNELMNCTDLVSFRIYKEMLFACFKNIYHIPFVYENKPCLFQLHCNGEKCELFLIFSVFGNLKFSIFRSQSELKTPFFKVMEFLKKHLQTPIVQEKGIEPLFEFKRRLDFRG